MEIVVIAWLLFSVGVGFLASERGRSWVGWTLLSILTSPLLGVIIVLVIRDLKEEASGREREEMRHREQLAALVGSKAIGVSDRGNDDRHWTQPKSLGEPAAATTTPLLVADELEKLASLRDRGLLTEQEFGEQKARLLGHRATAAPIGSDQSNTALRSGRLTPSSLTADVTSADKCVSTLISLGYRVTRPQGPEEDKWEIADPKSHVVSHAYSFAQLQSKTLELAHPR